MLAPLVCQQQGTTARRRTLTVAGLDVAGYAPIDSWSLEQAAQGQVSALTFTLEDPTSVLSPDEGDVVVLWDTTLDRPEFAGYVVTLTYEQMAPGRRITVRAAGAEALLDWGQVPAMSIVSDGTLGINAAIQMLTAACDWPAFSPLRAIVGTSASGSTTGPIGFVGAQWLIPATTMAIPQGTLRASIASLWTALAGVYGAGGGGFPISLVLTVDFWWGLRAYPSDDASTPRHAISPGDMTKAAIFAGSLTTPNAEAPQYVVDAGATTRGVYVTGGNAAGTGFTVLTPVMGPTASVSDSTVLSAAAEANRAIAAANPTVTRSTLNLLDADPIPGLVPYMPMDFTWPQAFAGTQTTWVGTVRVGFNPSGRVDYAISMGAAAPSYAYAKGRP